MISTFFQHLKSLIWSIVVTSPDMRLIHINDLQSIMYFVNAVVKIHSFEFLLMPTRYCRRSKTCYLIYFFLNIDRKRDFLDKPRSIAYTKAVAMRRGS